MISVESYLAGRRFTWRGTMHDGSINRGGRRGRKPAELRASQQPPTHLLLDFLPTWPIPLESAYLNSRALVKPGYYYTRVENTYRDSRDRYCNSKSVFLSRKPSGNSMKPDSGRERSAWHAGYAGKCDYYCNSLKFDVKESAIQSDKSSHIRTFAIRREIRITLIIKSIFPSF